MRRRDFIKGFSAAATMSPLAAGAQQPERVRRIGVLLPLAAGDEAQARFTTFQQALKDWAGPMAVTSTSTPACRQAMPPTRANTRRN
jgi:hypothetical protein